MCSFVKVKAPPLRLKAISSILLMNLMNPMNSKTWNLLNDDNATCCLSIRQAMQQRAFYEDASKDHQNWQRKEVPTKKERF